VRLDPSLFQKSLTSPAHIDFDLHQAVDGLEEIELGEGSIGTTGKGIGPTFSCKAARSGVMLADIFNLPALEIKLRRLANGYQKRYGDLLKYDVEEEIARFQKYSEELRPFVVDEIPLLRSAKAQGANIVVEGAQAAMLDNSYGTYPFVTSSSCTVGGILSGVSLDWRSIKEVVGVVKAYTTRVGSGHLPTEQLNEYGKKLQSVGKEVGVTTGRTRRCGHLDLVVVKFSNEINGYTAINLTKLDILDDFEEIHVGVAYNHQGVELDSFPASQIILENVEVQYKVLPGWKSKTSGTKNFDELPENARKYIEYVEEFVGVPIKYIGTGPGRDDMIFRRGATLSS
jgi:adenylosuccinate synthase